MKAEHYIKTDVGDIYPILNSYKAVFSKGTPNDKLLEIMKRSSGDYPVVDDSLRSRLEGIESRILNEEEIPDSEVSDFVDLFSQSAMEDIKEILHAGIFLGDYFLAERAAKVAGSGLTNEMAQAILVYAVGCRGYSIDDAGTSVGAAYQHLYGKDFMDMEFPGNMPDGQKGAYKYTNFNKESKVNINKDILKRKGFSPVKLSPESNPLEDIPLLVKESIITTDEAWLRLMIPIVHDTGRDPEELQGYVQHVKKYVPKGEVYAERYGEVERVLGGLGSGEITPDAATSELDRIVFGRK